MQITSPCFDEDEIALLQQCLKSGWVTQGPLTERFESLVATRHQARHGIATTSCTAALHLAMLALDIGPGDEVIVPALTWTTTAHAVEYVGARAVFADVRLDSFNLDPDAVASAITPRTRAVIAVHLFGLAADMGAILPLAERHNLAVVEDAACAIGTQWNGRPVGTLGAMGCFSFHPRKVITTGEGGLITTQDDGLAEALRVLRNHGATGTPAPTEEEPLGPWTMTLFDRLGFNLRLSDIQASVGIAQMGKLEHLLDERRRLAAGYDRLLGDVPGLIRPVAPAAEPGHTYQSYVVRVAEGGRQRRNHLMARLAANDIQTRPGTHAVHRLGYYRNRYGLRPEDFPLAALAEDTTITLPIFPGMREEEQEQVATILAQS